jgi:Thaumatin family
MKAAALTAVTLVMLAVFAGAAASAQSSAATAAGARTITFVNHTDQTIWVAATPGSLAGVTGWKLPVGSSQSIRVSDRYNARIWGRTGCHFNAQGRGHCQTGDCGGRFQCTGWGQIPATLAEYNLDAWKHLDFYDVSMVDGSNLPMYINTVGGKTPDKIDANGCEQGHGCTTPVQCPQALQVRAGAAVVGCISPCARFGTNRYCCRGQYAKGCSPAHTWPIDYATVFKRAEPYAYSWSGDDSTSVFTCTGECGYRIVFGVSPHPVDRGSQAP